MPNRYAIVVAGGRGTRMQTDLPKQFLLLCGRPVLMRTLDALHSFDSHIKLIVVLPKGTLQQWTELCGLYKFEIPHITVIGGKTRFDSVLNGLRVIPDEESESVVAVHDAVRPFVSSSVLASCFEIASINGAAMPVIEVNDSLVRLYNEEDQVGRSVDRSHYRLVQTPQVFRLEILRKAYKQSFLPSFTDDASVVRFAGFDVALVAGNRENIKLTTPLDFLIAQVIVSQQNRNDRH